MAGLAQSVPDWLRQRAQLTPERIAILAEDGVRWSFGELDQRVDGAAESLRQSGVRTGQHIGIRAPNGPGFVLAVHALMRIGAVLVPINTRLTQTEIDWQRTDADLALVLDESALHELVTRPNTQTGKAPPGQPQGRDFDLNELHSIIYTSGTSGRPKGALLTYGNHWWSAVASALNLGLRAEDRWLVCLPLFHVGGLSILLKSVAYGMTTVIQRGFDAAQVNAAIDVNGVTIVSVVSTMLERMLTERDGRPYPDSLRCVLLGGGPAPLPLLERALSAHAPVVQTYGLTETASQITTLAPEDAVAKLGSAGKPLMGSQIRIETDGEICVQGPTVSPGYLHLPPRSGWLHTADLGYLDQDGYLYVLDRRDDLIVSGGENIYPAEVEAALLAHPSIEEVGVFGETDPEWGSRVVAAVTLRPDREASAAGLIAFCRQRLAGYKVPRRIEFRQSLPHNAAGKLLRRELRTDR